MIAKTQARDDRGLAQVVAGKELRSDPIGAVFEGRANSVC